ncbi:MAG: hypothetical protein KAS96_05645 [Planctomycetes bacterium]|nr:hypothetical protein [Planctomycetota bacterium]
MTPKQIAMNILTGKKTDKNLFSPDISEWYKDKRLKDITQSHKIPTGCLISDNMEINKNPGTMPKEFADWTYLDFYRNFNWGLHVHIYDWCRFEYENCTLNQHITDKQITKEFKTPIGTISRIDSIANDGSLCPVKLFIENESDWKTLLHVIKNTKPIADYQHIQNILNQIGDLGIADIVLWRSPFGKIVEEYAGLEKTAYTMMDKPQIIDEILQAQTAIDTQLVKLAADSPADIAILSDHADQQILNPIWYEKYCTPFYQKAGDILHKKNKIFSTHLDGNFKALFDLVKKSSFDLLDGCTPAPMTNYQVEELPQAMNDNMAAYCGVPAIFFVENYTNEEIITFAKRIIKALAGKVILNIGDILPANGNIYKTIELSRWLSDA